MAQRGETRDRERQRETERDRERQRETERDRERVCVVRVLYVAFVVWVMWCGVVYVVLSACCT